MGSSAPARGPASALSGTTRGFLFLVIAAIASFGVPLYLFPSGAGGYWAWTVADPRTAMLIGSVYFVPMIHYSLLLREREWVMVQTTLRSLFVVAAWLLVVAMMHWDTFYPWRFLTLTWLFSYYLPLLFLPILFRFEAGRSVEPDDPRGRRISPAWRNWLNIRALAYGTVAIAMFALPDRVAQGWPWTVEIVNVRMFSGQVAIFGAMPALVILDGSWRRMKLFIRLMAMMAVGHIVLLLVPVGPYAWGKPLGLVLLVVPVEWLLTATGIWMAHKGAHDR